MFSLLLGDWVEYFSIFLITIIGKDAPPVFSQLVFWWNSHQSCNQRLEPGLVGLSSWMTETQVSRVSHTTSHSSTKALPVLSSCRPMCTLENCVVQLRKQWQQRSSTTTTYWNYHYTAASVLGQKKGPASLCLDSNHSWSGCLQRTKSMASRNSSPFTVASQQIPAFEARCGFASIFHCRIMVCDHHLPPNS